MQYVWDVRIGSDGGARWWGISYLVHDWFINGNIFVVINYLFRCNSPVYIYRIEHGIFSRRSLFLHGYIDYKCTANTFQRRTLFSFNEQNKINAEQCEHGRNKIDRYVWIFFLVLFLFLLYFDLMQNLQTFYWKVKRLCVCVSTPLFPFQRFWVPHEDCFWTSEDSINRNFATLFGNFQPGHTHTRAHTQTLAELIQYSLFFYSFVRLFVVFIFASQNFVPLHKHTLYTLTESHYHCLHVS